MPCSPWPQAPHVGVDGITVKALAVVARIRRPGRPGRGLPGGPAGRWEAAWWRWVPRCRKAEVTGKLRPASSAAPAARWPRAGKGPACSTQRAPPVV